MDPLSVDPTSHTLTFVPGKVTLRQLEIVALEHTLRALGWNKSHTANALGISRASVHLKIKKYRLVRPPLAIHPELKALSDQFNNPEDPRRED